MPTPTRGLHASRLGIKKTGKAAVDYMTDLIDVTITFDPPSLATITGAVSSGITVTGAKLGDMVEVFPPYDTQGIIVQGNVSAADTVKFSMFNPTAGTIDLASSAAWRVKVVRP